MAERRIVEGTQSDIICFISNCSWPDDLSFTAMRERYLDVFDKVWIDCLNGDKDKTGKLTPEGDPRPEHLLDRMEPRGHPSRYGVTLLVRFRHLWGKEKRATLLATAEQDGDILSQCIEPPTHLGPFR